MPLVAQVILVLAVAHFSVLRAPLVVATAVYLVPVTRVKVVEMAPFFSDTLTPLGFAANGVVTSG
jgi:hypothetical protein